jgi:hypothetical protein
VGACSERLTTTFVRRQQHRLPGRSRPYI